MAADESTPTSLAAFHKRPRKAAPARQPATTDVQGQLGLLFVEQTEPSPKIAKIDPPKKERKVWTVRSLVADLRGHVEKDYSDEWVEGEISNCRSAPSGHFYFTLKDGDAQLPVVLFRRQAMLLRWKPEDGQSVLVRGSVSVYESRGQLQLIAETLEPRGEGALRLAYEQLRQKLLAEGLFDAERKRALPRFPKTIGVITSTAGAVLRDIANISKRRHACLNLLIYPALMQGAESADEVRAAIAYFNSEAAPKVDLILIARGGGSTEDLWGFNNEALARAIAASGLPVVSAIGHETDFTIADFVADLRAPTPSAAAELITEHQHRVGEQVDMLETRLERAMRYQQMHARQSFARLNSAIAVSRVRDAVERRQQHVDALRFRAENAMSTLLQRHNVLLTGVQHRLARQDAGRRVDADRRLFTLLEQRLGASMIAPLQQMRMHLRTEDARLRALSPESVLRRGYALVFDAKGRLLRNAAEVQDGDAIVARLASGEIKARVTDDEGNA
ncbi:exodeoxyribonuclease VII large subunit [Terriglobus saanensis]|uniref:Exodeoxyribonuclease 7 large subunit n=1 Tax=Terriglobus saanensis (strain ATCC BAA-1853 / DSM 23119 / SP1PR4) TaxID=401053 RepID=E8UZ66_TERSS|nr:exodeoxyribonuclease VII large subunit [Terriglobus saanensis]ADV82084.1 exodeoxyribonuclease VII, large subunit [Terriglobus saanensis SP1PR4]